MATSNVEATRIPQVPYSSLNLWLDATQPMLAWWTEQSTYCMKPITSFHMAWLEGFSQAMQAELEFLQALTESHEKIVRCIIDTPATPDSDLKMANCYQEIIQTLTNANMDRLKKASELAHEFRKSLWEEL